MPNMADFKYLLPVSRVGTNLIVAFLTATAGGGLGGMVAIDAARAKANTPSADEVKVAQDAASKLRQLATAPQPYPVSSVTNPVARFVLSECQAQFASSANRQHINVCLINKAEDFSRTVLKPLEAKPTGQGALVAQGVGIGALAGAAIGLLVVRRRKPAPSA